MRQTWVFLLTTIGPDGAGRCFRGGRHKWLCGCRASSTFSVRAVYHSSRCESMLTVSGFARPSRQRITLIPQLC